MNRRQRRRLPVVPLLLLLLVLAAAAGAGYVLISRQAAGNRQKDVAGRFSTAWARGDYPAMWRLLTPQKRREWPLAQFADSYRVASREASVTRVRVSDAGKAQNGRFPLAVVVQTKIFGALKGTVQLPVVDQDGDPFVDWSPSLRLPGLRGGERVRRRILARPARRPILAAGGTHLDAEPTAAGIVGRAPTGSDPGSGLEAVYDTVVGGRPGAELRFGSRIVRRVAVRRGHALRTTIRPSVQRTVTSALGGKLGGVAVVNPRTGDVLGLAGLALSGPQPPGSTFKIITLSGALSAGIATPSSAYPVRQYALLSGVRLRNASDESCGGSLPNAFAVSCNSVFAPLGARLGAKRLVKLAESFGFNEDVSQLPGASKSTIHHDLRDDLAVGAAAIGQERDLATTLEMATVGATIGNHGVRARPRIVRSQKVRRHRVVSARVAGEVRDMMLGVVRSGTGTAAALPGVEVAGKTGTAELRPTATGPPDPKNTDAWFVAFAPASRPKVAVAVMLVGAGAGGAAAAPIARQVLAASLGL